MAQSHAAIDFDDALRDPALTFPEPNDVVAERRLSRQDKIRLLQQWERDAWNLAVAEDEGMTGGEESRLGRVRGALRQLGQRGYAEEAGVDARSLPADRFGRPAAQRLHPVVYKIVVFLALWFVLAAWGFFGSGGYAEFSLAVVSVFVFVVMALVYKLRRIPIKYGDPRANNRTARPLADWLSSDFETWQARLKGADALVAILLPLLAGAVGMTAFAIARHFALHG